jgi:phage gp46-like protein
MGNPTRYIDPETRDWKLFRGERLTDETMVSSVLFLLRLRYNSSAALPLAGSKLHELDKITDDIAERIDTEVARTLQPLVDVALISNVKTTSTVIEEPGKETYVKTEVKFDDARGEPQQATFGLSF